MTDTVTFELGGKLALVTGASSGLGWHFARTLARHGARVAVAARREAELEQLASAIERDGGSAFPVLMDVRDADSVSRAFDAIEDAAGTPTILVNNSGLARPSPALDVDEESWSTVVGTNLDGAWRVARENARRMVAAGVGGSIINILSILAFRVAGGLSSYSASKGGLLQLTRAMGLELARHGIRVNAIAPGYIVTDMNRAFFSSAEGESMIRRVPQRRVGEPSDLDGALLLLASEASRYMTGSTITVDGGHLCSSL